MHICQLSSKVDTRSLIWVCVLYEFGMFDYYLLLSKWNFRSSVECLQYLIAFKELQCTCSNHPQGRTAVMNYIASIASAQSQGIKLMLKACVSKNVLVPTNKVLSRRATKLATVSLFYYEPLFFINSFLRIFCPPAALRVKASHIDFHHGDLVSIGRQQLHLWSLVV